VSGFQDLENHEEIRDIVDFATEHLRTADDSSSFARKLIQVMHVKSQIVAGKSYELVLRMGQTTCLKNSLTKIEDCPLFKGKKHVEECTMKIWSKPWENFKEVTNVKCKKVHQMDHHSREKDLLADHESRRSLKRLQSRSNFKKFMKKHGKRYANKREYHYRFGIFQENMKKVQFLRETELGTGVYGNSPLADLTEEEFKRDYLGYKPELKDPDVHWPNATIPNVPLPKSFDWRKHGAVTEVKNQGSCGSCWAFSVTGNIEGQLHLKNKSLLSLSEQELVDCDKLDNGCGGGLPDNAYKSIIKLGGLETEKDYSYEGENEKCSLDKSKIKVKISGAVDISKNETQMAQWLIVNGPMSIGLNANAMQFYMGGVSHPWKFLCSPANLDHGVLIVGFGIHKYPLFNKIMPFWIVKNSWGKSWGESGYYRVYRGDGTCGLNQMVSSALL